MALLGLRPMLVRPVSRPLSSPSPAFLSRFPLSLYVLARVHVPVPLSKYIYSPSHTPRAPPAVAYVCVRMQIRTRHAFAREAWIERRKSTVAARSEATFRFDRGEFFVTNRERERERERENRHLFRIKINNTTARNNMKMVLMARSKGA